MRVPKCINLNNRMCLGGGGTSMRRREQSTKSFTTCVGNETSDEIAKQRKEQTYI